MAEDCMKASGFISNVEMTIPDWFPAVYETKRGGLHVYLGAILEDNREMGIGRNPYWAAGRHSTDADIKKRIIGFYKLENGFICKSTFVDKDTYLPYEVVKKDEYVDLPKGSSTYYGICACRSHKENPSDTRKAFGLTYKELNQVLEAYGSVFKLGNIYQSFPKITRSNQRDNCCDLSRAWIPKGFPYIAFDASDHPFSHVSLSAFYLHLKLLLLHGERSIIWQKMAKCGVDERLLEHIVNISDYSLSSVRYGEYSGLCQ